jgi:hypothetical protein
MIMKKITYTLFLLFFSFSLYAADLSVTLMGPPIQAGVADGYDKTLSSDLEVDEHKGKINYYLSKGELTNKWKQFYFEITPTTSGDVLLILAGNYLNVNESVAYDHFEFEGVAIDQGVKNPSFELFEPEKFNPKWWWGEYQEKQVIRYADDAKDGECYILATDTGVVRTKLVVESGEKVRVSFFAKLKKGIE